MVNKGRPHVTVGHVLGGMRTRFQYQFTHCTKKKRVQPIVQCHTQEANAARLCSATKP